YFSHASLTAETYPLSLHDALPICGEATAAPASSEMNARRSIPLIPAQAGIQDGRAAERLGPRFRGDERIGALSLSVTRSPRRRADRKSTRLNSSHLVISYAVFCLK